eukprot:351732-Chlamydomonas_euryale.AAC.17
MPAPCRARIRRVCDWHRALLSKQIGEQLASQVGDTTDGKVQSTTIATTDNKGTVTRQGSASVSV